jgi:hypothetical protein
MSMQSRRIISGIIGILLVTGAVYALSTVPGINEKLDESVTFIENEVNSLSNSISEDESEIDAKENSNTETIDSSVQLRSEKYDVFAIHNEEVSNG